MINELQGMDFDRRLVDSITQIWVLLVLAMITWVQQGLPMTPCSTFTFAAASFVKPKARMTVGGMRSRGWLIGKF
jgi:hypothetical protein